MNQGRMEGVANDAATDERLDTKLHPALSAVNQSHLQPGRNARRRTFRPPPGRLHISKRRFREMGGEIIAVQPRRNIHMRATQDERDPIRNPHVKICKKRTAPWNRRPCRIAEARDEKPFEGETGRRLLAGHRRLQAIKYSTHPKGGR